MRVGAQLLLTFLLNASWQIALVAGFALVCDWLLRGIAARYRHGVWVAVVLVPGSSTAEFCERDRVVLKLKIKTAAGGNRRRTDLCHFSLLT